MRGEAMAISPEANEVTKILRSDECKGIGFQVGQSSYFGYHYKYAADLVDKGALIIGTPNPVPELAGEYDPYNQTFHFAGGGAAGFFNTVNGQDTVVHECTHAILHFTHSGKMVRHKDDEFAAWLAPTIYRILKKLGVPGEKENSHPFHRSLYLVAQDCIRSFGLQVPSTAVEFVGDFLIAGEKASAARTKSNRIHSEFEKLPPFRQTPLPPMQPDGPTPWL
jgi:hypothetical protein